MGNAQFAICLQNAMNCVRLPLLYKYLTYAKYLLTAFIRIPNSIQDKPEQQGGREGSLTQSPHYLRELVGEIRKLGMCEAAVEDLGCGFEGFEKRLEIEFTCNSNYYCCCWSKGKGKAMPSLLRSLPLWALEEILSGAGCSIVSGLSNPELDSYVLSESSLFVFPLKMIIKTCGTTQLLNAIPPLLKHAAALSLTVHSCRYSRGAFLFPQAQPYPHSNFAQEVDFLDHYFATLGSAGSKAYRLMDGNWHVYSAVAEAEAEPKESCCSSAAASSFIYTLEVCMTQLDTSIASNFFNQNGNGSAREMSVSSGIVNINLPLTAAAAAEAEAEAEADADADFEMCEYAFDPCGYSMNAISVQGGGAYSTIHITPEEHCSYASFEITEKTNLDRPRLQCFINKIASTFRPRTFSFSLYKCNIKGEEEEEEEESLNDLHLYGYEDECTKPIRKTLPGGGVIHFFYFTKIATK